MRAVMLDLMGTELTQEEQELLQHPQVGGLILFTRNYTSPEQLQDLMQRIRGLKLAHLLVTVDHEGGRVQRFRTGFTELPALGKIGALYNTQPEQAKQLADTHAWLMATELRAFDIDFSFAPVLDLNKHISTIIGDRAFSADPALVSVLASSYIQGMRRAGMAAVGKHFPGHGSVAADSHLAIPIDPRPYPEIAAEDLFPFVHCVKSGLAGMMPAHIIYTEVDDKPAGFSELWLKTVLREQLGFKGAIFSDDLSMQGASALGDMQARAQAAFKAGCDMVLVCNDRPGAISVLEHLERTRFKSTTEQLQRLEAMRGQSALKREELFKSTDWHTAVSALASLA